MGDIVQLAPPSFGDGAVIDPDKVLEAANGAFEQVVVVGYAKDGTFALRSSHGSREIMWILRRAELFLLTETE